MDPDSTAGSSDCRPASSDKYSNVDDDYISKLLGFEDNYTTEGANSSNADKTIPADHLKMNHDQVTPEGTSELKVVNGHSQMPTNESLDDSFEDTHHNEIDNGFSLARKLKELMQMKKDADDLHEKWERTEKERNELQIQVNLLQAENHQFKHLKNEKDEHSQKVNELQKDLANKLKAQLKLRNEIEVCNLQISEKNDAIKKMKKDNKSLWNMVTRFARKLADADLLTPKEKNTVKKYGEENHIPVDTFESEDQRDEKDHSSLVPTSEMPVDMKQNIESVENENRTGESDNCLPTHKNSEIKNSKARKDGFPFSQSSTSFSKPKHSTGANFLMKSCREVIEDPHVSDDCLDVTVNELKEMRRQLSASNDHFSPISPLPPTPPPTSNKFRHGLSRKNMIVDNRVLTEPVHRITSQTPKISKSQGLLSVNSPVPSSSRKLTFCHQQSEGFDAPTEQPTAKRFNSDSGNSNHHDLNISSHTETSLAPYIFSAKRCHDGTVKLNFHINNPISMTVNPNNWEVSCILGQHEGGTSDTPFAVQPSVETANVQTYESFSHNLVSSEKNEPVIKKISKVEPASPRELTTPVLKSSEERSFVSVGKPNVSQPNVLNQDISVYTNSFGHYSKETSLQKEMPMDHPHISITGSRALDAFANQHKNNTNCQLLENHVDDNRSVVSSSCESPSPYRKKNELFSKEFSSPSRNLTPPASEVKSRKLDNFSNVSKMCSLSVPEVNCQVAYDSTGSESELTDKSKLTKMSSTKCVPIKKRRKSSLMASVESSNIVPARNKGRTLLSRAFTSTKNSISPNTNLEVKKLESNNDENKKSTAVQLTNEKHLSENQGKLEEESKFNSSSDINDPGSCMKLSNSSVEENEDASEQMETLYENVKGKKRVSRFKAKTSQITSANRLNIAKQKNESVVGKNLKKKDKKNGKVELKRMAALKKRAAEFAAQRMSGDVDEKEIIGEEPFDTNISALNAIPDSLQKSDSEKSINDILSKTVKPHEEKISDIFQMKPKEVNNSSSDSVNIPVGSCVKIENKDVSVKMINDTLSNVPSTDHLTNNKIEANLKMNVEKSNILIPDSTACSISKNDQLEELFHTLEVDNNPNDNDSVLASNHCDISAGTGFPMNHATELIKNPKSGKIQNPGLFKPSSSFESHNLSKNEVHKSLQETSNSPYITNSMSSPLPKSPPLKIKSPKSSPLKMKSPKSSPLKMKSPKSSPLKMKSPKSSLKIKSPKSSPLKIKSPKSSPLKIKSPKSSPLKIKSPKSSPLKMKSFRSSGTKTKFSDESTAMAESSGFNSFSNIKKSENKAEFPKLSLPPLPLDPFRLSGDINDTISPTKAFVGETFAESPISPSLQGSSKLSVLDNKELSKLTLLSENKNNAENLNNAKTNLSTLFNQEEYTDESFLDFLVKDEVNDLSIKTISSTETKEKLSSTRSADNSLGKTAVEELQTSSQTISNSRVATEASSVKSVSDVYSNIDMIIDSVAVGGIEIEVETQDPPPRTSRKRPGPVVNTSPHVQKRKAKGGLKSIDLSIAKESALSDGDTNHVNGQISEADSDICGVEIEVETQDPSPRSCKERQSSVIDSSHHTEKRKVKGSLKSIDLSIAKESALSDGDTKHINGQLFEDDSDIESQLVIAEDFEEIQQPVPISEDESLERNVLNSVDKNTSNKKQKNVTKTPKKIENKTESADIDEALKAIDKIKFSETHFKLHVHNLVTIFINPSKVNSSTKLAFHLIRYLHNTRKNPMLSFSLSNDPETLLPMTEQCILKALLSVDAKNKPHLSGLLTYVVETLYQLVLGKMQYHVYGLSSLCRVMTAICKELNDPSKPRHLCCDVLKYNHKFAPFLIASIVSVYREAFEVLPDTTEEEKIFLSALSYGVQQKPKTLTETQWKHCNNVFSKYLTVESLTNISETIPYLMSAIEDKCLYAFYHNEYMLLGPLVIYARVQGWAWALEKLLQDYVLPNLQAYSNKENGEKAFSFFINLCAEICYGCPDEELSRSFFMKYLRSPGEREFVQIYAGAALLKLILLRREFFPDEVQEWIQNYHEDPRVVESSNVYFQLRLMEEQELIIGEDNMIF